MPAASAVIGMTGAATTANGAYRIKPPARAILVMGKFKPYLVTAAVVFVVLFAVFRLNLLGSRNIVMPPAA